MKLVQGLLEVCKCDGFSDPQRKFISLTLRLEIGPTKQTKHSHSFSPRDPLIMRKSWFGPWRMVT
jgi:hypothetical protein